MLRPHGSPHQPQTMQSSVLLADFNGALLVGPVWVGANPRPGDAFSGCSTRSEDFYMATNGDILLAIREDFYMARDTNNHPNIRRLVWSLGVAHGRPPGTKVQVKATASDCRRRREIL